MFPDLLAVRETGIACVQKCDPIEADSSVGEGFSQSEVRSDAKVDFC